jgi:hypothetical protein
MAVSKDLVAQEAFAEPQGSLNPKPATLASAATIAPSHKLTRITGAVIITTITPPQDGFHILWLVFTTGATANALNTGGNIAAAWTSVADRPIALLYDPRTALYYPQTVA